MTRKGERCGNTLAPVAPGPRVDTWAIESGEPAIAAVASARPTPADLGRRHPSGRSGGSPRSVESVCVAKIGLLH